MPFPGDREHWLLGDTDTEWDGEVDTPVANRADVDYVLAKVNSVLRRTGGTGTRSAACSPGSVRWLPPRAPPTRPGSHASTGCSRPSRA